MIGWWIIQSHQARGIYSQRSNNKLVVHWMSVFSTVEPRFTDTRLIRTPCVYARKFRLSRRKAHIVSLKLTRLIWTLVNTAKTRTFSNWHVSTTPLYVASHAGKIKQLFLVKVSALVFVSIKQYARDVFWESAKNRHPDNVRHIVALLIYSIFSNSMRSRKHFLPDNLKVITIVWTSVIF